jgi:hypothetical protein
MRGSLGEKIGEGALSDAHAWAPGQVVKLFKSGVPRRLGRHEARVTHAVFASGGGRSSASKRPCARRTEAQRAQCRHSVERCCGAMPQSPHAAEDNEREEPPNSITAQAERAVA